MTSELRGSRLKIGNAHHRRVSRCMCLISQTRQKPAIAHFGNTRVGEPPGLALHTDVTPSTITFHRLMYMTRHAQHARLRYTDAQARSSS
jgi:hypothetical protein